MGVGWSIQGINPNPADRIASLSGFCPESEQERNSEEFPLSS